MTESLRPISTLTAVEIREHLASGHERVEAFSARLAEVVAAADEPIRAFAHLDARVIALQAGRLEKQRSAGELPGPLFGVPVGVKDIIDTAEYPTEYGSPIHAGRHAGTDAPVVARLRAAGAIVFGKTVTTEFATFQPSITRNPHDLDHTPGGSSSGSAAAVAAGMVPVAIGSQTNGSIIRPASYCGVYGFKPSLGLLPRSGVLDQSPSLDQLGVFARSVEDLALLAELMSGDDGRDPASARQFPRRLHEVAMAEPPSRPRFCFVQTPWWDQVEPEAQAAYQRFLHRLGDLVDRETLPEIATSTVEWHARVNNVELAFCLRKEWNDSRDRISGPLRERIAEGMAVPVMDYLAARERMPHVRHAFDNHFSRYDAILCPAALGTAPRGLGFTGSPLMQTVWSFAGLPSVNLPLLQLSNGLPLGVQAVGAFQDDARLLRSVRWLVAEFAKSKAA